MVAGVLASSAQVYSANVVGYINLTIKPGYNLICNQLTNGNNNLNVCLTNGVVDGMTISSFTGTGFTAGDQYYAGYGWADADVALTSTAMQPGKGYMLFSPATTNVVMTLLGDVPQGNFVTTVPAGYSMLGSVVPVVSGLSTNGFPAIDGTTYATFDGAGYVGTLQYYAGYGWADADVALKDPTPAVGQGFLINSPSVGAWNRSFTVGP